jgi:hypothetical protein
MTATNMSDGTLDPTAERSDWRPGGCLPTIP